VGAGQQEQERSCTEPACTGAAKVARDGATHDHRANPAGSRAIAARPKFPTEHDHNNAAGDDHRHAARDHHLDAAGNDHLDAAGNDHRDAASLSQGARQDPGP